jgi:hypothetical protein
MALRSRGSTVLPRSAGHGSEQAGSVASGGKRGVVRVLLALGAASCVAYVLVRRADAPLAAGLPGTVLVVGEPGASANGLQGPWPGPFGSAATGSAASGAGAPGSAASATATATATASSWHAPESSAGASESELWSRLSSRAGFPARAFQTYLGGYRTRAQRMHTRDSFELSYADVHDAKTRTEVSPGMSDAQLSNAGGCRFRGPRLISGGSAEAEAAAAAAALAALASGAGQGVADALAAHLGAEGERRAKVLSLERHDLCSWDPSVVLPSLPAFSHPWSLAERAAEAPAAGAVRGSGPLGLKFPENDLQESGYVLHDVCVTQNVASIKMVQRGVLFVDPGNNDTSRCVPCPNPQMGGSWRQSNRCGIMWLHQYNARSLADVRPCFEAQQRRISSLGQAQRPLLAHQPLHGAVYYEQPTLLVQFTHGNPGHMLWDSLFSLATMLRSQEAHGAHYWARTITHSVPGGGCPGNIWFCELARALGLFEAGVGAVGAGAGAGLGASADALRASRQPADAAAAAAAAAAAGENHLPVLPGVMTCFRDLVVAEQGWNHFNQHSSPDLVDWLRARLTSAFKLERAPNSVADTLGLVRAFLEPPGVSSGVSSGGVSSGGVSSGGVSSGGGSAGSLRNKYSMLFYAHNTKGEAGFRRAWMDVAETQAALAQVHPDFDVRLVPDFGALSVREQAAAFAGADIVIMPHGGQFGNSIFLRENTIVIEMSCSGYSHLAAGSRLPKALRILHFNTVPCKCAGAEQDDNFWFSVKDIADVMHEIKKRLEAMQTAGASSAKYEPWDWKCKK